MLRMIYPWLVHTTALALFVPQLAYLPMGKSPGGGKMDMARNSQITTPYFVTKMLMFDLYVAF